MIDHPLHRELTDIPTRPKPTLFWYPQVAGITSQPKDKGKEEPIDVDSSDDDSILKTNNIVRLLVIKVKKLDIYNKERNSLED